MNVPKLATEHCKANQNLNVFDYDVASEAEAGRPTHRRWIAKLRVLESSQRTAGTAAPWPMPSVASFGVVSGFGLASVLAGAGIMTTWSLMHWNAT
jgi:hypothetical protein